MFMPRRYERDLFDDLFDEPFFANTNRDYRKVFGHRYNHIMKTDIKETDDNYELEIDLPGFTKDEIKISLEDGYVTVSAEKDTEVEENDKKNKKYIRKERYSGACKRSFYVGTAVTKDEIKAEFKNGILVLTVPKKNEKPAAENKTYIDIEG